MKKILLLIICVQLSGCALYDSYFMASYDNNEYGMVNNIRTISMLSVDDCSNQYVSKLNFDLLYDYAIELKNYSQFLPHNEDTFKMSDNLVQLSKQGVDMYNRDTPVSETFCKLKMQQINRSSETIQKVVGSKPR